jgi:DNA-binding beta-propeller fold protein YncE/mono/diheme cytochrome c family protein
MRKIGIRQTEVLGGVALAVLLSACNSFDDPPSQDPNEPRLVIPVDEREATTASVRPTAISGGTLTVLADGSAVAVSDPERDTVSLVDLNGLTVRQTVALQPGDEPGRSVEDADKRIHVVLRGGGAVAVIDATSGALVERRSVCKSPRGVAFQALTGQIHVACAEGKLVSLAAKDGALMRTLTLAADLRDVLVRGSELWVTRFKSAELLRIGSAGTLDKQSALPRSIGMLSKPPSKSQENFEGPSTKDVTVEPGVAWRAVSAPSGGAVIVHQQAVVDEIELSEPSTQGSAYGGGGFDCSGIVKNAISTMAPDGTVVTTTLQGAPLPVDVAVSANWVAVAHAGPADFAAPRPFLQFPQNGGDVGPTSGGGSVGFGNTVTVISQATLQAGSQCAFNELFVPLSEPATAVAFAPNDKLLVQTRQPAQLVVVSDINAASFTNIVSLSTESRFDTGHEIFHRDAGGGIACASCHPEGGEDGKTWRFSGTGERRTQALHVGLRDTAPFHWNGDLTNVGSLMSEVFVGRMGGVRESEARLSTLSEWLFSIKAPPAIRDAGDPAVTRGQELFNSAEVACATCHSGAKLTNNESVSIDSVATAKLQVPSLVAVGYRAPFMHTGCAASLTARFDPACGGNLHGNTTGLSEAQIGDLVAYLEAL